MKGTTKIQKFKKLTVHSQQHKQQKIFKTLHFNAGLLLFINSSVSSLHIFV